VKNHKNIRKNLLELVTAFPNLLFDRNELLRYYWTIYDSATNVDVLSRATSAESITRSLRRLAQLGLVNLPNREKMAERQREFEHEFASLA
jgi:hypothetical protein